MPSTGRKNSLHITAGFVGRLLCVLTLASPMLAVTFTTIDFPGATSTQVYGINNAGLAVGVFVDTANVTHGFLLNNGSFTTIDYPGATLTVAAGINNDNQIVGQYNDSAGFGHGFLLEGGSFTSVDFPPYQTFPTAISDAGDIVGFCIGTRNDYHGCVSVNGTFHRLDVPGAVFTVGIGINFSQTKAVGGYGLANGSTRGFVFNNGHFTDVIVPGAQSTAAYGINDVNVVIGNFSLPGSPATHGFVLYAGTFHDADFPGAASTYPINLNNSSALVGWYIDKSGVQHGYKMSLH